MCLLLCRSVSDFVMIWCIQLLMHWKFYALMYRCTKVWWINILTHWCINLRVKGNHIGCCHLATTPTLLIKAEWPLDNAWSVVVIYEGKPHPQQQGVEFKGSRLMQLKHTWSDNNKGGRVGWRDHAAVPMFIARAEGTMNNSRPTVGWVSGRVSAITRSNRIQGNWRDEVVMCKAKLQRERLRRTTSGSKQWWTMTGEVVQVIGSTPVLCWRQSLRLRRGGTNNEPQHGGSVSVMVSIME